MVSGRINVLFAFLILFLLSSCEGSFTERCEHGYVKVINNSNTTLYILPDLSNYPNISTKNLGVDPIEHGRVRYSSVNHFRLPSKGWNDVAISETINCLSSHHLNKNDTSEKIVVYFFDSALIYSTSWDYVKQNELYVKRYILNYDSLEQRGWKIVYP